MGWATLWTIFSQAHLVISERSSEGDDVPLGLSDFSWYNICTKPQKYTK
jgi:hypothetical protein